jgi:hypothetical protein
VGTISVGMGSDLKMVRIAIRKLQVIVSPLMLNYIDDK